MIIGVMSDTHGNRLLMHRAAEAMRGAGATVLFHLGDDYGDGEELGWAGFDTRIVPGLWCAEYRKGGVPNVLVDSFDGLSIGCAHAEQDLKGFVRRATLLLHGHTHRAEIRKRSDTVFLNPGHLKKAENRGQRASYALVHIEAEDFQIEIHELDGTVRQRRSFARPASGNTEEDS